VNKKVVALIAVIVAASVGTGIGYQTFYEIEQADVQVKDSNVYIQDSNVTLGENASITNLPTPTPKPTPPPIVDHSIKITVMIDYAEVAREDGNETSTVTLQFNMTLTKIENAASFIIQPWKIALNGILPLQESIFDSKVFDSERLKLNKTVTIQKQYEIPAATKSYALTYPCEATWTVTFTEVN
jgi:hypothetical protein